MRALVALLALVACTKAEREPSKDPAPGVAPRASIPVACTQDAECTAVETGCCGCMNMGERIAIRADASEAYVAALGCKGDEICAMAISNDPSCQQVAACRAGRCALVDRTAVAPAPVDAAVADASLLDAMEDAVTDAELLANPPRTCTKASDCVLAAAGCCPCTKMGKQRSIRRDVSARYHRALRASCGSPMCPAAISNDPSCYGTPTCVRGTCSFKPGKNPYVEPPPPAGGE